MMVKAMLTKQTNASTQNTRQPNLSQRGALLRDLRAAMGS